MVRGLRVFSVCGELSSARLPSVGPSPQALRRQGILDVGCLERSRVKAVIPCLLPPAPVVVTPPRSVHNVTGAQVYLSCEVRAVPTPVITWRKVLTSKNSVCMCVCV